VHDLAGLCAKPAVEGGARVERRVLKRAAQARRRVFIAPHSARHAPESQALSMGRRRLNPLGLARCSNPKREARLAAASPFNVVEDEGVARPVYARPVPADEAVFERLSTEVGVKIPLTAPGAVRMAQFYLDLCARGDGAPKVSSFTVDREGVAHHRSRMQSDRSAKGKWDWGGDFSKIDLQRAFIPSHLAWPDRQGVRFLMQGVAPPLGHGPALTVGAIERDVHRAMVEGISPARPRVVGGKDTADKGNYRDAAPSILAQGVDIPPAIAARGNRNVEARSLISRAAANRPDKAAIGTPAPGCAPPPAW